MFTLPRSFGSFTQTVALVTDDFLISCKNRCNVKLFSDTTARVIKLPGGQNTEGVLSSTHTGVVVINTRQKSTRA